MFPDADFDPKRVIDRSAKLPIYNNFKVIETGKVPKSMFLHQGEPNSNIHVPI